MSSYCRPNLAQSTFPWYETNRNEPITRSISRGDSLSLSKSYFCSKWAFWAARPVSKSLENFLVTVASAKTKWNFLYSIKYLSVQNSPCASYKYLHNGAKSSYISHAESNFYGAEIEIWAVFGPDGNTVKKLWPIISDFWGQFFHVFIDKRNF